MTHPTTRIGARTPTHRHSVTPILILLLSTLLLSGLLQAQGLLPSTEKEKTEAPAQPKPEYVLINQQVSSSLLVTDSEGKLRPLMSYKVPLEQLVIQFLSARCPYNKAAWHDLKVFYEAYQGWHVSFLAISANKDETAEELNQALQKAGLPYPVVRDENQVVARRLHAVATPEIIILDEDGLLRYRGPLHDAMQTPGKKPHTQFAREAMDAVIGHVESVPNPEPGAFIGCSIH